MEDYEANYFDFSLTQTNLPYITAVGSGPAFAYHKSKALSTLRLFAETTCVCAAAPPVFGDTASATLTYDATGTVNSKNSTIGFGKACVGECAAGDKSCTKSSSMIEQRNPTCDVKYYRGGKAVGIPQRVCKHTALGSSSGGRDGQRRRGLRVVDCVHHLQRSQTVSV